MIVVVEIRFPGLVPISAEVNVPDRYHYTPKHANQGPPIEALYHARFRTALATAIQDAIWNEYRRVLLEESDGKTNR